MRDHIDVLFARYRTRGLLIDTNLLLLYFVGLHDPRYISSFKRTNTFTADDFMLLTRIADYFEVVVVTPNVLTEVSNLLGHLPDGRKEASLTAFRQVVPALREEHRASSSLCKHPQFSQFRLTDISIAEVAADAYLVLTDDLPLYAFLARSSGNAVNFNNLRMANW